MILSLRDIKDITTVRLYQGKYYGYTYNTLHYISYHISLPFRFPFSRLTRYLVRLGKGTEGNVMTDRSSRDERGKRVRGM